LGVGAFCDGVGVETVEIVDDVVAVGFNQGVEVVEWGLLDFPGVLEPQ